MNVPMQRALAVLAAVSILAWLAARGTADPPSPARAQVATEAEKAVAAKSATDAAESDAKRGSKFAAERSAVVANAKKLNAAGKYRDVSLLGYEYEWAKDSELDAQVAKAREKLYAADAAADRAKRRREGVSIGMSEQQVAESSWGRPERVNKTTTASGTREQWVYPGAHNYLYFENGILVSVQN